MSVFAPIADVASTAPIDERIVYGHLKAVGATDPDVLHAHKAAMSISAKQAIQYAQRLAIGNTVFIALLVISALGIVLVPFVLFVYPLAAYAAWWGRRRLRIIERGYRRYAAEVGIPS